MTLSGNGARTYTNLNYQKGGFTPFASQEGLGGMADEIDIFSDSAQNESNKARDLYIGSQLASGGPLFMKRPGLLGLGDDTLYTDVGVNPAYMGTQLSTDPVTSIQNLLVGGSPTGLLLIGVGVLFVFAIMGKR